MWTFVAFDDVKIAPRTILCLFWKLPNGSGLLDQHRSLGIFCLQILRGRALFYSLTLIILTCLTVITKVSLRALK